LKLSYFYTYKINNTTKKLFCKIFEGHRRWNNRFPFLINSQDFNVCSLDTQYSFLVLFLLLASKIARDPDQNRSMYNGGR
jgi:hypothetical protein